MLDIMFEERGHATLTEFQDDSAAVRSSWFAHLPSSAELGKRRPLYRSDPHVKRPRRPPPPGICGGCVTVRARCAPARLDGGSYQCAARRVLLARCASQRVTAHCS
jgi:hypothetical protein